MVAKSRRTTSNSPLDNGVKQSNTDSGTLPSERRTSSRIKNINTVKAEKINTAKKISTEKAKALPTRTREESSTVAVSRKKRKRYQRKTDVETQVTETNCDAPPNETNCDTPPNEANGDSTTIESILAQNGIASAKSASAKVKETLRTFNKLYLLLKKKGDVEVPNPNDKQPDKKAKSKKGDAKVIKRNSKRPCTKVITKKGDAEALKRKSKRPDLKALSIMLDSKCTLYRKKRFGAVPGIDVGHQFFSRAEMVAVGLHGHWLNGIDYIGQNAKGDFSGYTLPLTTVIVLSGQYEDDLDNCEDVVYTGQGGNDLLGNKHQLKDQILERGNLGLKNCMEQNVPVRVVRGHKSDSSYVKKVYTYDGLYKVVKYWAEKGLSGFTVFKFRMQRIEGQPVLTTEQVQYTRGRAPVSASEIRGLVCEDIAVGQEKLLIPATNLVDDPPIAPTDFTYLQRIEVADNVKLPRNAPGCGCKGSCKDPKKCACAKLNGSDFPYVPCNGGRLIEPKAVVFECGPNCGCGPGCINRTSQRGMKYRLEVFRTPKKGWAVRSWEFIPSGAPVCEYIGVLMKTDDIDPAAENNYVFDIDCLQTMKGLDGRERRLVDVSIPTYMENGDDHKSESVPEYCIDAVSKGNIARFINHSCEPNLFVQCVLSSHHDIKFARVVLFAADNIPPLKELTYDYGYVLDSVRGPDGKIKKMACYCGAADCRKRLF